MKVGIFLRLNVRTRNVCKKKQPRLLHSPERNRPRNLECQTVAANQGTLAAHSRKEEKSHINKFKKIFQKWASSVQKPYRLTKRKGWIANLSFFKRRIDSLAAEKGRGRITRLFGMGGRICVIRRRSQVSLSLAKRGRGKVS